MIVGAAIAVTDALGWICPHAATARGMILIVALSNRKDLRPVRLSHSVVDALNVRLCSRFALKSGLIQAVTDFGHWITKAIPVCRIQSQRAVARGVAVVIHSDSGNTMGQSRLPVLHEIVPEEKVSRFRFQARTTAGVGFEDLDIVPDKRLVRRAAEVLTRDDRVWLVHPGKELLVHFHV